MKGEFVARVMNVWPHLKDDVSFSAFVSDIQEKESLGWEFSDVLRYLRTFEEINPHLEEEEAFRRRNTIEAKYLDGNVELYEVRFSSLAPLISR